MFAMSLSVDATQLGSNFFARGLWSHFVWPFRSLFNFKAFVCSVAVCLLLNCFFTFKLFVYFFQQRLWPTPDRRSSWGGGRNLRSLWATQPWRRTTRGGRDHSISSRGGRKATETPHGERGFHCTGCPICLSPWLVWLSTILPNRKFIRWRSFRLEQIGQWEHLIWSDGPMQWELLF